MNRFDGNKNDFTDLDALNRENYAPKEGSVKKGVFISGVMVGMAGALLILSVVYLGTRMQALLETRRNLQISTSAEIIEEHETFADEETLAKIQIIEKTIKDFFYLSEVTDEELEAGIYRGMVDALNDPYSQYYSAEELTQILQDTQGIYYGVGAYVGLDSETGLPKISGVIEKTPAEEAGLRENDLIYEVDGTSTYGLTLTETVSMIKGAEGTKVNLTLIREGESNYVNLSVERRRVESPTVNYEMLEDNMAYIQIVEFDDVTVDQFAEALAVVKGSGMRGLILDLRANPGGSLDAVVEIAQMILPEGMIVYTEGKSGRHAEYTCDGTRALEVPLVVLVDMNSASAAEILAGAVKDHGIGTLVGTTTFGKGIVQQIIPYNDGSAVKLTMSSYFTPNGNNIHGIGIVPDIECEFDGEAYYNAENPFDNQLDKAKEVLREKIK